MHTSAAPAPAAAAGAAAAAQAGTVTFNGQVVYSSYEQWLADVDRHCVAPDTPYSWQPGGWQNWNSAKQQDVQQLKAIFYPLIYSCLT
jgi:hypothetical protein